MNNALAAIRTSLENCFLEYVAVGTVPTPEQFRRAIDPAAQEPVAAPIVLVTAAEPVEDTQPDLLTTYAQWSTEQAHRVNPRTIQSNQTSLRHLHAFQATAAIVWPSIRLPQPLPPSLRPTCSPRPGSRTTH